MSSNVQQITRTGVLLAIALTVQLMHLPTYFTGPAINAVLILAGIFVGITGGVLIGCITPGVALMMGIIPPVVAPLVPVIMLANATLVVVFKLLSQTNQYVALTAAALAKYTIFFLAINYLLQYFNIKLPPPALLAFQLPQLYTALAGGLIAVIVARYVIKEI
ncbi:MAG: ECF transporter S component [Firmicutes bacterium]|nr:ECF transporter S component [Bacillota bacterium]